MNSRDRQSLRISAAARIFVLIALGVPLLFPRNRMVVEDQPLQALMAIGFIWAIACQVEPQSA